MRTSGAMNGSLCHLQTKEVMALVTHGAVREQNGDGYKYGTRRWAEAGGNRALAGEGGGGKSRKDTRKERGALVLVAFMVAFGV
mmetsp:Transcript_24022/g.55261  ORF Transcript_24022/g.55261 Transcript_24022/m.55261 type:complete len:84 (+) Transcript_24022:278-529(+)